MKKHYIINQLFMYMTGHYDRSGKLCTQVFHTTGTFMVDRSPLEILDDSIRSIGFELRGAMDTSRRLHGNVHMCPVMVNPIYQIVAFPTRSHKHEETIWFNPNHIMRTTSFNRKTAITFSNGFTLIIPTRLSSFNTKLTNAEQYRDMITGMPGSHFTFILDPAKRPVKK